MLDKFILHVFSVAIAVAAALFVTPTLAQVDEGQTGAWYMYLWSLADEGSNMGFQGDIQHRNWDLGGDLEQLLIRGGLTWKPSSALVKYTFGAAHVVSKPFGPSSDASRENRVYQEAVIPQRVGRKFFLTHRFRFEQRWVDNQDLRTRLRYFIGLNVPLNQDTLGAGATYLAFYNELFVNLNQNIGNNRRVDHFDRNRSYMAFGYSLRDNLRFQLGYMHQQTDTIGKGQLQFSILHSM